MKNTKFKIADPKWRTKLSKSLDSLEIYYLEVFKVADYKSDIKSTKFKMDST